MQCWKRSFLRNCRLALEGMSDSIDLLMVASTIEFCRIWPNVSRVLIKTLWNSFCDIYWQSKLCKWALLSENQTGWHHITAWFRWKSNFLLICPKNLHRFCFVLGFISLHIKPNLTHLKFTKQFLSSFFLLSTSNDYWSHQRLIYFIFLQNLLYCRIV